MRQSRDLIALSLVAALVASGCGGGGGSSATTSSGSTGGAWHTRRQHAATTFQQVAHRLASRYPSSHFTSRIRGTILTLHADGSAYVVKRNGSPKQAKQVVRTLRPPHAKNPLLIVSRGPYTFFVPRGSLQIAKAQDLTPAQQRDFGRVVAQF